MRIAGPKRRGRYSTKGHMTKWRMHYKKVHDWIKDRRGNATFCRIDASHKSRGFDWANISRKYYFKDEDWMPMCKSCHHLFDANNYTLEELKERVRQRDKLVADTIKLNPPSPQAAAYKKLVYLYSLDTFHGK